MSNDTGTGQETVQPIGGGLGNNVPAWDRPDLLASAPGGIALLTPAHHVMSAGATASWVAQQDINFSSLRNTAIAVQSGLSLYTHGQASSATKPNQETGMQLHAAAGNVSVQAQQNTLNLTADKTVEVASVTDAVTINSPTKVGLFAGGASIVINSSGITLTTLGAAQFKGAMKELTGPASASASLSLPKAGKLAECSTALASAGVNGASAI